MEGLPPRRVDKGASAFRSTKGPLRVEVSRALQSRRRHFRLHTTPEPWKGMLKVNSP